MVDNVYVIGEEKTEHFVTAVTVIILSRNTLVRVRDNELNDSVFSFSPRAPTFYNRFRVIS